MANQQIVRHGTVGATVINVDMSRVEHSAPVRVTLTANYAIERPAGLPSRPSLTGTKEANLDYPRTIAAGTVMSLLKAEADALVAAGAATYA